MTALLRAVWPAALVAATLLTACGGDGGSSTPAAGETAEQPTASPTGSATGVCTLDLAGADADLHVFAATAGDFLADRFSLALGDFNGDGKDDILAGAPLADGPDESRANAGEAYVIFGSNDLPAAKDLADDAPDLTVYGELAADNAGFTVAAGDVNGDGIDDVLVGGRFASAGGKVGVGKVYVVFGGDDLGASVDTAAGDQDATVIGPAAGDYLSIALASGDVDGDGTADLLLGASGADGPDDDRDSAGEVHVVLGRDSWPASLDLAETPPHFTAYGATAGDSLPNYLAAGDLDGDGREELIVGAPFASGGEGQEDAGRVYIVPVPEEGGAADLAGQGDFTTLARGPTRAGFGFYVAAGDLDDDGNDDVLIGARDADGPDDTRNNSGEALILWKAADLPELLDLAEAGADLTVYGQDQGDSLGFTVATGDVNGDGTEDALFGAPIGDGCNNAAEDAGEAHVLLGRKDWPQVVDLASEGSDRSYYGGGAGDEVGFSLASGDVNGDGYDDVVLGALLADGPDDARPDSGEVYVILGGRSP